MNVCPVSIVCASYMGRKKLPNLVDSIYKSSLYPSEIVICVTSEEEVKDIYDPNSIIETVVSPRANQVTQRILAINKSKNEIIIQVDDDIVFDQYAIEKLYLRIIKSRKNEIVGGSVFCHDERRQSSRWAFYYSKNIFFKFALFVLNGFKNFNSFSVIMSGRIIPRLPGDRRKIINHASWSPSFMSYRKSILPEAEFISSTTKSFYEDVYFSQSLVEKGFKITVIDNARIYHEISPSTSYKLYLKTISAQYRIVSRFGLSHLAFFADIFFSHLYFLTNTLYKQFKS